jgi:hypothetical protein
VGGAVFCVHPANGPSPVNFPLTFSLFSLPLMDLRRNRLDGGLTRLQPAPTPDKYEENTARDAIATRASSFSGCAQALISASQNIFNGLFRVPVKIKNPALNRI